MAAITDGAGGSERWSLHVRYSRQEVDRWRRRLVMWNRGGDRPNRRVDLLHPPIFQNSLPECKDSDWAV